MAQYARPDGDVTRTNVASGTYASIDEVTPSDTDYLYGTNNTAVTYECSLTDVLAPESGTRTVRYRVVKTNAGTPSGTGNATVVTAYLVQGTSVLQTDTQRTLSGTWTTYEMVVTATVTDYADVRLRFYSPASGGSAANRRSVGLSWAEFEIPNAAPASIEETADADVEKAIDADDQLQAGNTASIAKDLSVTITPLLEVGDSITQQIVVGVGIAADLLPVESTTQLNRQMAITISGGLVFEETLYDPAP